MTGRQDIAMADFTARLQKLRPEAGEARFVYFEHAFGVPSVKVLPGEFFVWNEDIAIQTVLGSCIAVCLHDAVAGIGGMNHFLLPDDGRELAVAQADSARYGVHAMELLVNRMMKGGAVRSRLQAKVFGGASVIAGATQLKVGDRNVEFVDHYLATERIPVLARDVLDRHARRVVFFPASGKAMVKRLPSTATSEIRDREADLTKRRTAPMPGGTVELF
ncbi:MAG: chemoreceptor glutamine deamidase CheD [Lautropia sp.]